LFICNASIFGLYALKQVNNKSNYYTIAASLINYFFYIIESHIDFSAVAITISFQVIIEIHGVHYWE